MQNIISAAELFEIRKDSDVLILDATIPKVVKESNASTPTKKYIEGAHFFDIKKTFSNPKSAMPNTLPTPTLFEQAARKLGINSSSRIVVYDDLGIYSSPRVWWMLKTMGHSQVRVLDGGLPEWIKRGYKTTSEAIENKTLGNFKASFNAESVRDFEFVQSCIKNKNAVVIDARSSDRFNSLVPEPRADLRSGHISDSINIPYTAVLENGKFKSPEKLEMVFKNIKNENRPLVFSCGSGITACVVHLACTGILENKQSIYDGSWTEYAQLSKE